MKSDTCRSKTGAWTPATTIAAAALFLIVAIPVRALADDSWKPVVAAMQAQITALQKQVQTLQMALASKQAQNAFALGQYVSVTQQSQYGVRGPNVIFGGVNVHIRSGSGRTVDNSGLGNLVVGYDDDFGVTGLDAYRSGSNNLVVGDDHQFTSSGGLLAGYENTIGAPYASVSGGIGNISTGEYSSISGGGYNNSEGFASSVSGGINNFATGDEASVSGGVSNYATIGMASVSGGFSNTASAYYASVLGGSSNVASGVGSSVTGGFHNLNNSGNQVMP